MDTFFHHFSTFLTVYSTDKVNTGNRVLDNSIIAIITLLFVEGLGYIFKNFNKLYNLSVYIVYRMKSNPLNMKIAPYHIKNKTEYTNDTFMREYTSSFVGWMMSDESKELSNMNGKEYTELFYDLLKENNSQPLIGGNNYLSGENDYSKLEEYKDLRRGLYPICIDGSGNIVYYSTIGKIYYKEISDYVNIKPHIKEYLGNKYIEKKNTKENNEEIYTTILDDNGNAKKKSIGKISHRKTFDTLFYKQKEELLTILEKFKAKQMYPSHIPMDNKLGILLYGPPGTGKTGTISAIANYLGRSLTVINFALINTCKQLDTILDPEKYKETIYVFDEFDCILDVLGLENREKEKDHTDWSSLLFAAEGEERKNIMKMMKEGKRPNVDANIDMAYLLQKLDGLESAEDRIIIATTNNPEKINPALLRPGRFDMKLCLGNCTKDMYGRILENYFKEEKDVYQRVNAAQIEEYKYSPLQLMNLAMQNSSLETLLQKL
jgi:DNA replication protein DnaC